jgi:hypothetical protein
MVGLVVGFAWLPMMKASFSKSQQELLKSVKRHDAAERSQQIPWVVRGACAAISKFNDVVFTLFRCLCVAVSVLAMLVYIIGLLGTNLVVVVLGSR